MTGLAQIVRDQYKRLPLPPAGAHTGQTAIVTGSNTGLGFEAAKHLVALGASRVILAVRSPAKGAAAAAAIAAATRRPGVAEAWPLDLASNASVRAFAERAERELERVDVLLENAGVALDRWTTVKQEEGEDGVRTETETTVQVNVVGTMLLALLMLPLLKRSARRSSGGGGAPPPPPHLTIVTSGLHQDARFEEGAAEDVFAALAEEDEARMADRYPVSKLLEVYATRELAALLPVDHTGVVVNLLCPGLCSTDLIRNVGWPYWLQIVAMRALLARSAEAGSRTLLHAAGAGRGSHGQVVGDCEVDRADKTAPFVTTEEGRRMQKKVWEQLVARLEGIAPGCLRAALA